MSVDREPFLMLAFAFSLLVTTGTIFFFMIRWALNYTSQWELIVAIILSVISGVFIVLILVLSVYTGREAIKEIIYLIQVRREEREIGEKAKL